MTKTQNLNSLKDLFPFAAIENLSHAMADDTLFRAAKKDNESQATMRLPVNNYLKTPEEIETEFYHVMISRKPVSRERNKSWENDALSIYESGGHMNIHTMEVALSGFMEENY